MSDNDVADNGGKVKDRPIAIEKILIMPRYEKLAQEAETAKNSSEATKTQAKKKDIVNNVAHDQW